METLRKHDQHGLVPRHCVRVASERTRVGLPGQQGEAEPEIILIRNGEVVEAIEVICTCGQRIRMNCVF
jgi:hypothetical protein